MARVEGQMWIDKVSPNKLKYYVNKMEYEVEVAPSFPLDSDSDTSKNLKKGQMVCIKNGKLYPAQFPCDMTNTVGVMGTTFTVTENLVTTTYANVVRNGILILEEEELKEAFDTLEVPSTINASNLIGAPVYWFIGRWDTPSHYIDPSTKIGKLSLYTPSGFQWGITSVEEPSFNVGYDYLPTVGTVKSVTMDTEEANKLASMVIDLNFTGIEESFGWAWPHFHFGDKDTLPPDENNKVEITVRHGLFPKVKTSSDSSYIARPSCVCQTIITDDNSIEYNANVSIQNDTNNFDTKLEMLTPDTYRYLVHGSISYRLDKGHK